jgi:hypothetical protein
MIKKVVLDVNVFVSALFVIDSNAAMLFPQVGSVLFLKSFSPKKKFPLSLMTLITGSSNARLPEMPP